jgi:hypothetical protein
MMVTMTWRRAGLIAPVLIGLLAAAPATAGGDPDPFRPPGADAGGYSTVAAAPALPGRSTSASREVEYAEIAQIMAEAEAVQTSPVVLRSKDAWEDVKAAYGEKDPRALDAQSRALAEVVSTQTSALRMYDNVIDRLEDLVYESGGGGTSVSEQLMQEYEVQLGELQVEARWRATECYLDPKTCRPMSDADAALLHEVKDMMEIIRGGSDPRFDPEGMLRTARLLRLRSQTAIQVAKAAGVSIVLDWVARTRPDGRIPRVDLPIDRPAPGRAPTVGAPMGDPYVD